MGFSILVFLHLVAVAVQGQAESTPGAIVLLLLADSCSVRADRAAHHILDVDEPETESTTTTSAAPTQEGSTANGDDEQDPDAAEDNPEKDPVADTYKEKKSSRNRFKEAQDTQIATGLSIMFLGMIFLVGFVAWLISYPDKQVRHYCVRTASSTVVIFMAIAIDHACIVFTVTEYITGWQGWKLAVAPFFAYWTLTIFVSFKLRSQPLNMAAARNVISHVSAFIAITAFSDMLYKLSSKKSFEPWQALSCRVGAWLTMMVAFRALRWLSGILLRRLPYGCEVPPDGEHHADGLAGHAEHDHNHQGGEDTPESVAVFIEEVEEALEEASLIAMSYLFTKFLVYKTVLEVFDLKYQEATYDQRANFWKVGNEAVVEAVLVIVCVVVFLNCFIVLLDRSVVAGLDRYREMSTFLSMCMAWSFMRLVRCLIMMPISEDNCILILTAFAMTPMSGLLVVAADHLADTGMISEALANTLVTSYGFMIGFSWEKAFASASNLLLGEYFHISHGDHKRPNDIAAFWTGLGVCIALVTVMFPGWRYLILPHALKPIPPRTELQKDVAEIHEK
mmetsp:Transcript_41023/g.95360  ORF Transcript_41023/g.95360 Transcript_41023/m.95360 type:complete len:564 (+) Transcript_41023:73-1764(+)